MTKKRILSLVCLLLLVVLGGEVILSAFSVYAAAAATSYSGVLEDLEKDSSFRKEDYPEKADDYSLDIITLAEGENNELFVYVYQPANFSKDLKASKINMSTQDITDENITYSLYDLVWLSSDGVFDKYLVHNFSVSSVEKRYYSIATIYRAFDPSIDSPALYADDTKDYIGLPVGRCWSIYWYNGRCTVESVKTDYVDVEIQSVGYTVFDEGFKLYLDKCHAHFIAFSIENFSVQQIYDADVIYKYSDCSRTLKGSSVIKEEKSEPKEKKITIDGEMTGSNDADGLLGKKYVWERISTIDEFIKETKDATNDYLFSDGYEKLKNAQFVFRFLETSYSLSNGQNGYVFEWTTEVSEVSILRLHFLSNGKTYNLGVVADIVSDDGNPDFVAKMDEEIQFLIAVVCLILLILVLSIVFPWFSFVIKVCFNGLVVILKICCSLLLLPFRLFRKNKK